MKMTATELRMEARRAIRRAEVAREFGNMSDYRLYLNRAKALNNARRLAERSLRWREQQKR